MKRGERAPEPDPTAVQFRVLTSYELWRRTWWVVAYGILVLLVGEAITLFGHHGVDPSFLLVMVLFILILVGLYLRQRWHYVELAPEALVVRSWFQRTFIPYSVMRQSRSQPLRAFFDTPTRRDLLSGRLRRYAGNTVCLLRLDVDADELNRVGRQLGKRTVLDQDLILLVRRAEQLDQALRSRIKRRPPAPAARTTRRR